MKKILIGLITFSALLLIKADQGSALTVADYPAGSSANGIAGSRHNLGGLGRVITTVDTSEICVFCHTPHHTNTANGQKPLWNRANSASATYTAYGTTLAGTNVAAVGSTSLACLSCHDGVTTFDNIVNAPGKGGVNGTAGSGANGTATDRGWAFQMPTATFGMPSTVIDHFTTDVASCGACHTGADMNANINRLNIGTNLTNDHPVSVAYTPNVAGLRATNTVISSIDLVSDLASSATTAYNGNLTQNRWAVKGYISDDATIADLLRNGNVECTSCHDPHFRNLSWDEAEPSWADGFRTSYCGNSPEGCSDGQFLRRIGGNTGSGICRTCHNK